MFTTEMIQEMLVAKLRLAIRDALDEHAEQNTNLILYGFDPETGVIRTSPNKDAVPFEGLDSILNKHLKS